MHVVAVVGCLCVVVGRVDVVVSFQLALIHIGSAGVRLGLHVVRIARDVIGCGGGPCLRLVGVAAGVRLSQVGHAASVGVHVSPVAPTSPVPVGVVARSAVLYAGLTGVGGTIVKDVGAVAASAGGHHECRDGLSGFYGELGLGLQTPAPLTEMWWRVL